MYQIGYALLGYKYTGCAPIDTQLIHQHERSTLCIRLLVTAILPACRLLIDCCLVSKCGLRAALTGGVVCVLISLGFLLIRKVLLIPIIGRYFYTKPYQKTTISSQIYRLQLTSYRLFKYGLTCSLLYPVCRRYPDLSTRYLPPLFMLDLGIEFLR